MIKPCVLELDGCIKTADGTDYSNKIVILLKDDFSIRGWMSFEHALPQQSTFAHLVRGAWNEAGDMNFSLCFPKLMEAASNSPEQATDSTEFPAHYKFMGELTETKDSGPNISEFSGLCRFVSSGTDPDCFEPLPGINPDNPGSFLYCHFRRPSRDPSVQCRQKMQLLRKPSEFGSQKRYHVGS